MKTAQEIIKICSTCKNREFNLECGIVCSFTKDKPSFEDECGKYVPDEVQLSKEIPIPEELEEEKYSISGWLAVFLWVGVGLGALVSAFMGFAQTLGQGCGWFFSSTYSILIISLLVTATLTIIAFYKRKPNAVALATTYIAMIALDGIMSLIIAFVSDDSSIYPQAFRQLSWNAIWFTYLQQSSKVELISSYKRVNKSLLKFPTSAKEFRRIPKRPKQNPPCNVYISQEDALGLLKFEKPNVQYCIRSERMLRECLTYIQSEQI